MKSIVTWQSRTFDPKNVVAIYARGYSDGTVKLYDVDKKSKTIREYWVYRQELTHEQLAMIDNSDPTRAYNQVKIK